MKEQITGFILKCDSCDECMEIPDGGAAVFVAEDEIASSCEALEWKIDGEKYYCDNCKNNQK